MCDASSSKLPCTIQNSRMTAKIELAIAKGGSREEMRDSIGSQPGFRTTLHFIVDVKPNQIVTLVNVFGFRITRGGEWKLECVIESMAREDGSGQSWNLGGYLRLVGSTEIDLKFKAYYRTDRRIGVFTLEK